MKRVLLISLAMVLAISMVALGCPEPLPEPTAEEWYKGKTITLHTAVPGSGMDLMSRFVAGYLSEALDATVVVEPYYEIGGLRSYNELWLAPNDGTHLVGHSHSVAWQNWLMEQEVAIYEADELIYLGSILCPPMTLWTDAGGDYTTVEALMAGEGLVAGGASPLGYVTFWATLAGHWLDLDFGMLVGVGGPGPLKEALLLGEIDFFNISCHWTETYGVPFIPDCQPAVLLSDQRAKIFEDQGIDVPALTEVIDIPAGDATYFELMKLAGLYNMPGFAFAPGVPQDRVDYMRDVLKGIFTDPAFLAAAIAQFGEFDWVDYRQAEADFQVFKANKQAFFDILAVIQPYFITS